MMFLTPTPPTPRNHGDAVTKGVLLLLCANALSSCAARSTMPSVSGAATLAPIPAARAESPGRYIKHVIIVVQENRTFDNLFSGFPRADAPTFGYSGRQKIPLRPLSLNAPQYINNTWLNSIIAWDGGKMDGFEDVQLYGASSSAATIPYSFVPRSEIRPYWTLASQYVLADHMFPTEFGPSFTAHIDLISGNTQLEPGRLAEAGLPPNTDWTGCGAPPGAYSFTVNAQRIFGTGPAPCFTQFRTMADTLDAAHVSWRYYAPSISIQLPSQIWSPFADIRSVYFGPDWAKVISPETTVLKDIRRDNFPSVAWVIPDWLNSDHPANGSDSGPSWVTAVVNAVGTSRYWRSSAIFVLWDDWGGWYDNVPPPQLDYLGLAIRVPCIVVSPYARITPGQTKGYVDHTTYEFGSILRFIEGTFGLPTLGSVAEGYTDGRATTIGRAFDFSQKPRAFTKIPAKYPASRFASEAPSFRPPDDD
jgi:phospholipase C